MNFAFHNLHDFMMMGHLGVYVWSAWFITFFATMYLIVQSYVVRQRFFKVELAKNKLNKARAARLKQETQS
jgi:heme exporter protein CcmD